jgi:predicted Zn-dependent protease
MQARWFRPILWGLATLFLVATGGPVKAQDLYIRNRPVRDAVVRGQEHFVPLEDLERYLTAAEIERLELDLESGAIFVDGEPLAETIMFGEPARLPLVAVARALGFTRRANPELATVDLLSPQAVKAKERIPQTREGGRDYQIAKAVTAKLLDKKGLDGDPEAAARVTRIGNELVAVSRMPSLIWHFHVLADPTPNACTAGPGFVIITRGLLDLGLNDDELAGVLAHEIAHGTLRQLEKRLHLHEEMWGLEAQADRLQTIESALQDRIRALQSSEQALLSQLQSARQGNESNSYSALASQLSSCRARLSRLMLQLETVQTRRIQNAREWRYHNDQANSPFWRNAKELDADIQGMRLVVEAGYSADGLIRALLKISGAGFQEFGDSSLRPDMGASDSHPSLPTRIKLLEKVLQDWRNSGWNR